MRRKAARRRYLLNAIYVFVGIAVVGAIAYGTTRTKHGADLTAQERALLAQADSQATAAGCGPVQTIPAYSGAPDQAHIGLPGTETGPHGLAALLEVVRERASQRRPSTAPRAAAAKLTRVRRARFGSKAHQR